MSFNIYLCNAVACNVSPVWLFTCNIWMLIKCYLNYYNGVIKATLGVSWLRSVKRTVSRKRAGRDPVRVFRTPAPLHWTPTPARSLSASHSCLNMSQDGGQRRIDVSILEALWLTATTGQWTFRSSRLVGCSLRPRSPLSRAVFYFFYLEGGSFSAAAS